MKRRSTDHQEVTDHEIRKQRTAFDWAQLLLPNAPVIVKILLLLGLGAGTAVTAPKVIHSLNGTPPIAEGETVVPRETAEIQPEVLQSLESMNAAIKKLQARSASAESRLAKIEGVVQ